jgi:hypothetical protein
MSAELNTTKKKDFFLSIILFSAVLHIRPDPGQEQLFKGFFFFINTTKILILIKICYFCLLSHTKKTSQIDDKSPALPIEHLVFQTLPVLRIRIGSGFDKNLISTIL